MSNRIAALLVLFALFAVVVAVAIGFLQDTIDASAQTLVNHAVEADPLADVLQVREQSQNRDGRWWAFIALLLIGGLTFGGVLVAMGRFPKAANAWRRMRKPARQRSQQPASRVLPPQNIDPLRQLPRTPGVRPLDIMEDGYYE